MRKRVKIAKKMASGETLCNTLFYENLSKLKKGCFGLRLKAVFVFWLRLTYGAFTFHFFVE